MSAECWAHALGLALVVTAGPAGPDPLGACFECSVFGCAGHAEKDQTSGKWICVPSVAKALAASAGMGTVSAELRMDGAHALESRFPAIAAATGGARSQARDELLERFPHLPSVLGDAVGVARCLLPAEEGQPVHALARAQLGTVPLYAATVRHLFPGDFGHLLAELGS